MTKVIATLSSLFVFGCASVEPSTPVKPLKVRTFLQERFQNEEFQNATIADVIEQLIDPESARTTDLHAIKSTNKENGFSSTTVCGYINSKNRFGGYTGEKAFYKEFDSTNSPSKVWPARIVPRNSPSVSFSCMLDYEDGQTREKTLDN